MLPTRYFPMFCFSLMVLASCSKQSLESFNFINFNLGQMGEKENFRVIDNNQEHSISGDLGDGSIYIQALAASVDKQDSLNCNIGIADRLLSPMSVMI